MEDLYIHIHCARENGVSPVVAQKGTVEEGVTEINVDSDVNGGADPTADETSGQVHEFDINTLQFTNQRKEKVYVSGILQAYSFLKTILWCPPSTNRHVKDQLLVLKTPSQFTGQ